MIETAKITSMQPEITESWDNKLFITIDIDWVCDFVLDYTINLLEHLGIKATFFVTHFSSLLKTIEQSNSYELGIHPNFNSLLSGNSVNGRNAAEVLERIIEIVPNAKSIRSHSMTQNSSLLELFRKNGFTHDCNHYIPHNANIQLRPWYIWNNLIKCPYFWEDDIAFLQGDFDFAPTLLRKGLKIYNFHPIHLFLNTENPERYYAAKPFYHDHIKLNEFVNTTNYGTRNFLIDLINSSQNNNLIKQCY